MDALSIEKFKQRLADELAALRITSKTSQLATQTVELDQSAMGRLSRMDALQTQAMAQETERRNQDRMKAISNALIQMNSDDYGFCLQCDEAIPEQRLLFDPAATHCVKCASQLSDI